jgi:hypothetical protein
MRITITLFFLCTLVGLTGCSTRQLQDSLTGSTAQRLVTHSIDDLVKQLPESDFDNMRDQFVYVESHFVEDSPLKEYADERLAVELRQRFGARLVDNQEEAEWLVNVFYTSLATDRSDFGISIPLGFVPGVSETAKINVITLEKFHGISELYYFVGHSGSETRSDTYQAVVRTDALGLPLITIPISNVDRD